MSAQFLESVFVDSLKHPNFFNGRILTATDLRDEQHASVRRGRYQGQAAGEGVACGLNVTRATGGTALQITGGLAISRSGDALHLPGKSTTVELVIREPLSPEPNSPFMVCEPAGTVTLTGVVSTGFYVLAITTASRLSPELAPHSGLNGGAPSCANRYEEIGVQFKLIPLTNADLKISDEDDKASIGATAPQRRSHLAHVCFGTYDLAAFQADPLRTPPQYGLLDRLRNGASPRLTDCDVPLAVFQFRGGVVDFVDMWSVRRPCVPGMRPSVFPSDYSATLTEVFTQFAGPRSAVEAVAFLLQFQNHLEDIRTENSVNPPNVSAATYFEYLPAAGYLPIATREAHTRRFDITNFFGRDIEPEALDPAYLRSIFHESLYVTPIEVVGPVDVDLFTVPGTDENEPYVIFVRRPQLAAETAEPPQEATETDEGPTSPAERTGNLQVVVLAENGDPVPDTLVQDVRATNQRTGQVFTGKKRASRNIITGSYQRRQLENRLLEEQEKIRVKYGSEPSSRAEMRGRLGIFDKITIYVFDELPADKYTIAAIPVRLDYYSISKQVTVSRGTIGYETAVIRHKKGISPDEPELGLTDEFDLPWGVIVDDLLFDPRWKDIWPGGDPFPERDPGNIDPPPDDWVRIDDPSLGVKFEDLLGGGPGVPDPRVAMEGAEFYIRQGYNPAMPSNTVDAFVQTQDGTRYPVVVVAADHALDKPATVIRTDIPDFDAATYSQLDAYGMGSLEAVASAPVGLIGAVLGQSDSYAASLSEDSRSTLENDFQNGFMGYPGVTRAVSDALKGQFGDKVGLSNASPEAIASVISSVQGADAVAWASYSGRLLADVRATITLESFELGAAGIGGAGRAALEGIGVRTNNDLLNMAADEAGRAAVRDALGVNEATLDRYLDDALLNVARGQFLAAPRKSIATLEGMAPELAAGLARQGIYSARDLANSDAGLLAERTGFSEAELQPLVEAATEPRLGFSTLIEGVTRGAVSGDRMTGAGYRNVGSIARVEAGELEAIEGITSETATRLNNVSRRFMDSVSRSRFAGGF